MVEEGAEEGEDHVQVTVVYCFEHAAYAVVSAETDEIVGAVGRGKFTLEAGGGNCCGMAARVVLRYLRMRMPTKGKSVGNGRGR